MSGQAIDLLEVKAAKEARRQQLEAQASMAELLLLNRAQFAMLECLGDMLAQVQGVSPESWKKSKARALEAQGVRITGRKPRQ